MMDGSRCKQRHDGSSSEVTDGDNDEEGDDGDGSGELAGEQWRQDVGEVGMQR